jgi:FkbH-like protein
MEDNRIISRILRGLAQSGGDSLDTTVMKGVRFLTESAAAQLHLRSVDRLGAGARAMGRPIVDNAGRMEIGSGFVIRSYFAPVELVTGAQGALELGESVWVNFGTAIHAHGKIRIGDRVQIGQYSIISDIDAPTPPGAAPAEPRPITIGDDAWIAGRVTVLPGTTIGAGSVITAGSVVSGEIPPGVIAGGIPARVLRRVDGTTPSNGHPPEAAAEPAPVAPIATPAPAPKVEPAFRGLLLADFTVDDLQKQIERDPEAPGLAAEVGPFGQVVQALMGGPSADFAFIWTRPESTIHGFRRLLEFEPVPQEELLAEVDAFCNVVAGAAGGFKFVFVPTWTLPAWVRGMGALDTRELGLSKALWAMNLRLAENLAKAPNVHVLNAQRWIDAAGRGHAPKAWYMGKVAFHEDVFAEATRDLKAALRGLTGQARKLLVFDLDDTLWGGIVGDVGWENLRLGGHDAEGEAHVDLQRLAKALTRRGIVLGIVSKNEEATALEAIRKHPEMVLREEDFVGWRINWNDKARNIAELAQELNLGLQSVVFIDDNPVERARVRETLPEVLVPEWPEDKLLYPSAFGALRCFDVPSVTKEDAERTQMYGSERKRDALLKQVGSLDEWLKGLGIKVKAQRIDPANLARTTQLLNKTNQLNLTTRRLGEPELQSWASAAGHSLWALSVSDRFGDAGLTGIVSLEEAGGVGKIVDFVLSCRVMGRKVEETMLHLAVSEAVRRGLTRVEAQYLETKKNKPVLSFFLRSGFSAEDGSRFVWDAGQPYALPEAVTLEREG